MSTANEREIYATRAAEYRQTAVYQMTSANDLLNHFDGFRKWLKSGEKEVPAAYADYGSYQVRRDYHGTNKQEWMVMLPASAFGMYLIISLDTVIDLLRVLKSQKCNTMQVRAVPITPKLTHSDKSWKEDVFFWSALELVNCGDTYTLYSETRLTFEAQPELLPGADAGCFPAAHTCPEPCKALMIIPQTCKALMVIPAPVTPPTVCALCAAPATTTWDNRPVCQPCEQKIAAYELRLTARVNRLNNAAEKAHSEMAAVSKQAHQMAQAIPFGQPIHVGHYSEKRDRRYRDRIWKMYGRAVELLDKAQHYETRAAAAENNHAISSDDPAAVVKLQAKIDAAKALQADMKEANAIIRKYAKAGEDAQVAALIASGLDRASALALLQKDFAGRIGYPDYMLTNNNANIHRMEQRVKTLQAQARKAAALDTEAGKASREQHGGVELERDAATNRIRLHFPGKPRADVIKALKHHGFVWSPSNMAWQRQLNNAGEYAAKCVIKRINPMPQRFQPGQSVKVLLNERQPSNAGLVGVVEYAQRYDNGDVEYRIKFDGFGDYVNDWELEAIPE